MNHMHFEDRRRSRHFFWFIWVLYVLVYMTKNFFTAAMASVVSEGIMTKSQVGFIVAVFYIVYAPLQILGGICADRYDPEKLIMIGLLGGAFANMVLFFNQDYYVVLFTWIFNAVIQFGLWPAVFKIISSQIVRSDSKNAAYYMSFSTSAGLILSYAVAAIIPKWYYNFAVSAAVLFVLATILNFVAAVEMPYMFPDKTPKPVTVKSSSKQNGGALKLFFESGFILLIAIYLFAGTAGTSVKTLSATMLMETYENVSPSIGNILNILIISVSVVSIVLARVFFYPKTVKSAPTGIFVMLVISSVAAALLMSNVGIAPAVASLCVISGVHSVVWMLSSYCNLRFEKFGKSATAAGFMNMAASFGSVISGYGITRVADGYGWKAVLVLYFVLMAVSAGMIAVMLPLWKRFKKKYFTSNTGTLVTQK